jgi:pimeloyl-ACP methyl ester carboxylesterase
MLAPAKLEDGQTVRIGSQQVRYVRRKAPGAAPGDLPIVVLHGWGAHIEAVAPILAALEGGPDLIALDLPGFGESPMPSWPIDMPAYGRLIHDFCEKLGIDRVAALVGNSMGGFVSTEAVIERPERFERLVLVSAAGISFAEAEGRRIEATVSLFEATMAFTAGPRRLWLNRPKGRHFAFGRIFHNPNRIRPELLQEQMEPGIRAPGFADAIRAIGGYDTRHRLPEIEVPTLVVWGLNDKIVPVEAAIGYHRLIPESRLELFERTGHVPQMERPERFNQLLDDFLAGETVP